MLNFLDQETKAVVQSGNEIVNTLLQLKKYILNIFRYFYIVENEYIQLGSGKLLKK